MISPGIKGLNSVNVEKTIARASTRNRIKTGRLPQAKRGLFFGILLRLTPRDFNLQRNTQHYGTRNSEVV